MLCLREYQCSFLGTVASNFMYANINTNLSLDSSPSIWESALSWDNTNLPHPPCRCWTVFFSCLFFKSLDLHLEFFRSESLQPVVCIAAYIWLVGAVQSLEGDLETQDSKTGIVVRQGMARLAARGMVFDTPGMTIPAATQLLLLWQRCVAFVGVHLDGPVLENGCLICWVCTNGVLEMGRWPTPACLHGLSTCVCNTWWQTLARKMQTVPVARGSLVLTRACFQCS